jgi:hypothetical protein
VIIYLVTFLSAAALDFCYVRWMVHVRDDQALRAAVASMFIGACGLIGLTSVVNDVWAAPAYLAGLGCGTLLGMRK